MSATRMQLVQGDALAQLLQVTARAVGIDLRLTGRGQEDLTDALQAFKIAKNKNAEWSQAISDMIEFIHTQPDCPETEAIKAYIVAAVLRARVNFDIRNEPKVKP